jgi:MFS transporter, NNP family, nitrate/nitrite transporter
MSVPKLNLLNFRDPRIRTLHLTWGAFFLTFVVWFSHAPLVAMIRESFDLSTQQWKALLILNVALTIPSRIIVGMLVDRFGPRIVFSGLLAIGSFLCYAFAFAQSFQALAITRFFLGFVGAGFVIGIRMIGEWFPAKQVGLAEGIYGGWGNFGSAAAAFSLPALALWYGGANDGWRYAVATAGTMTLIYSVIFFRFARNTPKGATYFKPKKSGGIEVSSWRDLWILLAMNVPMYLALAVLVWKLGPSNLQMLGSSTALLMYAGLVLLFAYQTYNIWRVNAENLRKGVPEIDRYDFRQVMVLNWAYFVTFGSELAVVSMLPMFFIDTFGVSQLMAGGLAGGFAFMNLVARPSGGWFSDRFGRRKSLAILIAGLSVGYFMLSNVSGTWPLALAVVATMCCSFFVQAGEGAVFAIVPLVKRRMTGQIAGMTGAYGNVGAVVFLTVLSFVNYSTFFLVIAGSAIAILGLTAFLSEPEGHMAEVLDDGSVELIQLT